jgi:hypothetical protein
MTPHDSQLLNRSRSQAFCWRVFGKHSDLLLGWSSQEQRRRVAAIFDSGIESTIRLGAKPMLKPISPAFSKLGTRMVKNRWLKTSSAVAQNCSEARSLDFAFLETEKFSAVGVAYRKEFGCRVSKGFPKRCLRNPGVRLCSVRSGYEPLIEEYAGHTHQ